MVQLQIGCSSKLSMYISFVIQQSNRNIYMQKSGKEALCRSVDNFLEVGGGGGGAKDCAHESFALHFCNLLFRIYLKKV